MGKNKCSRDKCQLDVYQGGKCVLHCEKKSQYSHSDWQLYKDFNEALINNIAEQLEESSDNEDAIIDKQSAIRFLNGESFQVIFSNDEEMIRLSSNTLFNTIIFDYILFPQGKSQDSFFYNKTIKNLEAIHFNYCEFNVSYLELDNIQCFFQDCIFHVSWTIPNCKILENEDNVIYQTCIFHENISNYTPKKRKELAVYQASQFDYTCQFKKSINMHNAKFEKMLFNTNQNNYLDENSINKISFDFCLFEDKFKLNSYTINVFLCEDSIFKQKFEFRENILTSFNILNTNFEGIVDCNLSRFSTFYIEKSIFNRFVGFEECIFGNKEKKENQVALFKYVTFLDYSYFRRAKFYSGLDMENTNLEEYPNFLYIDIEPKYTNRETFRIIKHSFEKIGNTIEANKYFAYEMKKERENTSIKDDLNKKIMLNLNYWISNFGQSWIRPLSIILVIAVLHTLLIYGIDNKIFQIINPSNPMYDFLKWIVDFSNDLAKNIIPFKKPLIEGKEFISLVFLIIYSTLIYNFIVAVKRITKR